MGYNLTIGNATPFFEKTEYGELIAKWQVESDVHEQAPLFVNDEMTGQSNGRSPSYTAWADFCRATGLYDIFYSKEVESLLERHPGCVILTKEHAATITTALVAYRLRVKDKRPGFVKWNESEDPTVDAHLARLIWLEYWVRWAVENCETPALENS